VQSFQGGMIHASSVGAFLVPTASMAAYSGAGWLRGFLGWPTGDQVCDAAGCLQAFAGGSIRTPAGGTAHVVYPVTNTKIKTVYTASGAETGPLGYPLALVSTVTDKHGNGFAQAFDGGIIHSSAQGTFAVPTAVMKAYSAGGWLRGTLGWPTSADVCDATGCLQSFQGGKIHTTLAGVASVVAAVTNTHIRALYLANGGPGGSYGYALSPMTTVTEKTNGNGFAQAFDAGIVHSSAVGTFLVPTAIMTKYSQQGWVRGALGWPNGAASCAAGVCTQSFQHGTITAP
jgi:uncharacterized protein with LGFP repeats